MNINPQAKRILCYGDSNTWGWVPSKMGLERYPIDVRWPGILQKKLGENYEVIEEALGARTTAFDDPRPELPERNGLKSLQGILEAHLPLDLVIVMLGAADAKELLHKSSQDIAQGLRSMVQYIKNAKQVDGHLPPQVLIVVPIVVDDKAKFASTLFPGGTQKTKDLIGEYKKIADEEKCLYLNPNDIVEVDHSEGVHMNAQGHAKLTDLIYQLIHQYETQ